MKSAQPSQPNDVPQLLASDLYGAAEEVFLSRADRIKGASTRRFSDLIWDANDVLPRRPNIQRHQLRLSFPEHPTWSLRSREIAMALLNTSDPRLLARSVSFGSRAFSLGHVRSRCECYKVVAAWQLSHGLPDDISTWNNRDWTEMVRAQITKGTMNGTIRNIVSAVRDLVTLAPILTGGGIAADPWKGQSGKQIAKGAATGGTQVIPPQRWIPLISACWTYIDIFAEDILRLRDTHECELRPGMPAWRPHRIVTDDDRFENYLQAADAVVPMRVSNGKLTPNWSQLSRLMTADRAAGAMKAHRTIQQRRRQRVLDEIAAGTVRCEILTKEAFDELLAARVIANLTGGDAATKLRVKDSDALLEDWIDRVDSRVAVTSAQLCSAPDEITAADINWAMMERIVYRSELLTGLLSSGWAAAGRRQDKLVEMARSGRVFLAPRGVGSMGMHRLCNGFTRIDTADGQRRPWRMSLSDYEARCEMRALRAACFVFIAAMTMMRDSEIQDLRRGSMRTVHGVRAVTSNLYKGRTGKAVANWWIVDEVATAIGVLEKLSVHPEYLLARFVDGDLEDPEPGIRSGHEIAFLLGYFAEWGERSGLDPIPDGPAVSARALRRTTACISRELGGNELAISQQLKHVISYGYSNVTADYMAPDPEWANLLRTNRAEENIEHMVEIIQESARDARPMAGRGGQRLTQEMVQAGIYNGGAAAKATLLSDAEVAALLKKMAPMIHFGPANACLYDEQTALCRQQASAEVQGPLLGLCQPQRCANSVIAPRPMPVWIGELTTLQATLAEPRLSPPRRQALSERLADVEQVLADAQPHDPGDIQ